MKNVEMSKKAVKKNSVKLFGMSVLMAGTFALGGCGSDKAEKPKDEPTKEETNKQDDIPFEKMTKEEMDVLRAGDVVTKLPDSEYLNSMDLDFLFVYDQWIKTGTNEYPEESRLYYTNEYQKDGEIVVKVDNVVESTENYKLKEIIIGEMEYGKNQGNDQWYKYIYKSDGIAVPIVITSQERIDQLNNGEIQYKYNR